MKAYVATTKQIDQAFESWIDAGGESEQEERKFVHAIYQYFMATEQARLYHTVTGLVCYPLDNWIERFSAWAQSEIDQAPEKESQIRDLSGQVIGLLDSNWCIQHKLVARECLDEAELADVDG
ncbi:MAG: hypothetical protein ACI9V8_002157 [Urechidicola sp.]|jgi:hypothetical protein